MNQKIKDEKIMKQCLKLAEKGRLFVSPNPMVGAIVEKSGKIISGGYHKKFGGEHAEIIALKKAGKKAKNATLYVNLEPCDHYGKQPPCTKEIIKAGIKEVVIATIDPNPIVSGKGIKKLKKNGIKTKSGILEKEAQALNEKFFRFKKTKTPFVLIKIAVSLNGKISGQKGKKISGKKSLEKVHALRAEFDAILVGVNTVLKDNPLLTARTKKERNPLRIVLDSNARTPLYSRVLDSGAPTIIVCTKKAKKHRIKKLIEKKVGVMTVKEKNGFVDLKNLLIELGKSGISSVLVEGGAQVTSAIVKQKLFDKMILVASPKIIKVGKYFLTDKKLLKKLEISSSEFVGEDEWLTIYPKTV